MAMYGGEMASAPEKQPTLNDRLNKALNIVCDQCDRLEGVLSRVQGSPPKPANAGAVPIRGALSMNMAIEHLEQACARLVEMSHQIEHIA